MGEQGSNALFTGLLFIISLGRVLIRMRVHLISRNQNAERNSMQDALIAIACKMPQAQHLKAAVVAIAQPIVKRLYQIAHMQQVCKGHQPPCIY